MQKTEQCLNFRWLFVPLSYSACCIIALTSASFLFFGALLSVEYGVIRYIFVFKLKAVGALQEDFAFWSVTGSFHG